MEGLLAWVYSSGGRCVALGDSFTTYRPSAGLLNNSGGVGQVVSRRDTGSISSATLLGLGVTTACITEVSVSHALFHLREGSPRDRV